MFTHTFPHSFFCKPCLYDLYVCWLKTPVFQAGVGESRVKFSGLQTDCRLADIGITGLRKVHFLTEPGPEPSAAHRDAVGLVAPLLIFISQKLFDRYAPVKNNTEVGKPIANIR